MKPAPMSPLLFFLAVSAAQLALLGLIFERLIAMSTEQSKIVSSIEAATAELAATRAQVEKIGGEQASLIAKVDELTAALAATGTTFPPEVETAVAALNAELATLRSTVKTVDDQVLDAAPV